MIFSLKKNNNQRPDAELLLEYRSTGNKNLLGVLFERYSHLVYGLCLKYLKSEMSSQDAVIGIFEKLMDDLKKHDVKNFKSWLYMVAKNYCLMELREQQTMLKKDADFHNHSHSLKVVEDEDTEKKEEKISSLEDAIQALKPEQMACIELFYIQEKCYQEVSEITGYDQKQVKSYIQNGKRNLKNVLTTEHGKIFTS